LAVSVGKLAVLRVQRAGNCGIRVGRLDARIAASNTRIAADAFTHTSEIRAM